jgi:hypothetical protein
MPTAYVILQRTIPFQCFIEGSRWEVSSSTGCKSGYMTIWARAYPNRLYVLWAGRDDEFDQAITCGFPIASGTPERGLMTAMRRAGIVELLAEPRPRDAHRRRGPFYRD